MSQGVAALAAAGIPVLIDDKVRIAHNKIFAIDGTSVITGSLNSTASARKNAENVLVLDDGALA